MYKLDKEKSKRVAAFVMAGLMSVTFVSCSKDIKNNNSTQETTDTTPATTEAQVEQQINVDAVTQTQSKLKNMFPDLKSETVDNFALILLLNSLAPKDEQGKINPDTISKYIKNIDASNMMEDFNNVLDTLELMMIKEKRVISISQVLPLEYENDRVILAEIEKITSDIIKLANTGASKEAIISEFDKLYTLFVEEKEIEENGIKLKIRALDYGNRAVAEAYARTALYFARDYLLDKQIKNMDARTNDQNSKYYIRTTLDILDNGMEEVSETDVVKLFNDQYDGTYRTVSQKFAVEKSSIVNLINYLNMDYLNSNKVSYKDKNEILGEYSEESISNALFTIDTINAYNNNNTKDIIPYSYMLVMNYRVSDKGKVDSVALDFVQYNSIMLLRTVEKEDGFNEIFKNPYFQNLYKYFTKQDFTHTYGDGEVHNIAWQEISNGANFVCYEIIRDTLSKIECKDLGDLKKLVDENLVQAIQYIQNVIMGECEKVDVETYVNQK